MTRSRLVVAAGSLRSRRLLLPALRSSPLAALHLNSGAAKADEVTAERRDAET